jgi:hypothetical protein
MASKTDNSTDFLTEPNSGREVNMPVVRRSALEHLEIPLPPMDTQKRIADVYRLMDQERDLTLRLVENRSKIVRAACLGAAEREEA